MGKVQWEQELHDYADRMTEEGKTEAALLALCLAQALVIVEWKNGEPMFARVRREN